MRVEVSSIFLPWLAGQALAASHQRYIKPVCENIAGWSDCKGTIEYPSSSSPKICPDGKVCGVNIHYTTKNICTWVKDHMSPADGEFFVSKIRAICGNMAFIRQYAEAEGNQAMWKDGDLSYGSHPVMLDVMANFEKNIIDADINVGGTRAGVIRSTFTGEDGWKYIRGADMNLARYRSLLKAVRPCWESTCDETELEDFVASWTSDSDDIDNGEFNRMIRAWITLFSNIENHQIKPVKSLSATVQSRLKTVKAKVDSVKKSACVGSACKGKTATDYLGKVSKALAAVDALKSIPAACDKATTGAQQMRDEIWNIIRDLEHLPDGTFIASRLESRRVSYAGDMFMFLPISDSMPDRARTLKSTVTPLNNLAKLKDTAYSASKLVDGILSQNWKNNAELSKTASSRKVRDGFIAIQAETKKQLKDPLTKLIAALKAIDTSLNSFHLRKKSLEWQVYYAKYNWYTVGSFNVPCMTMTKRNFEESGFKATSKAYPVYESCPYGPELLSFPNAYIPYIKYRFI